VKRKRENSEKEKRKVKRKRENSEKEKRK